MHRISRTRTSAISRPSSQLPLAKESKRNDIPLSRSPRAFLFYISTAIPSYRQRIHRISRGPEESLAFVGQRTRAAIVKIFDKRIDENVRPTRRRVQISSREISPAIIRFPWRFKRFTAGESFSLGRTIGDLMEFNYIRRFLIEFVTFFSHPLLPRLISRVFCVHVTAASNRENST